MADETKIAEDGRARQAQGTGRRSHPNKMAKTIVVRVDAGFRTRQFKKVVTAYKKFYAHDEKGEAGPGDKRAHR